MPTLIDAADRDGPPPTRLGMASRKPRVAKLLASTAALVSVLASQVTPGRLTCDSTSAQFGGAYDHSAQVQRFGTEHQQLGFL